MDFNDWMEELSQSMTQNFTLMLDKFTSFANEFEQEAIQPATKDANKLVSKFSTQVFQPIARDLGIFTRELFDDFVQPAFLQTDVFFDQIDEKFIKPAGKDLRKLQEDLGIAKEMKELYRTLDISSEEEFLRILCAFIAIGGTTLLVANIALYMQSGGDLENFSSFSFSTKDSHLLDEKNQREFNAILKELNAILKESENQIVWDMGSYGNIQERYAVKTPTNQFFIERQINNPGLNLSDTDINLVALPIIISYLDTIFKIAHLAFLRNVDMNTFNNDNKFVDTTIANYVSQLNGSIQQQVNQQINISERRQTLAHAAEEIQLLLKQLEKTNPQATEKEKISYVNDETTPNFKSRVVSALQAGSESAIEEFLDNPYVNVGKAIIKGWLKPE